jgi:PAT family beta-lactamase induction signal transducer AmpG
VTANSPRKAGGWWNAAGVYRDRRVLVLLFLGFASGLPFGVLAEPLVAWLIEAGVSKTEVGLIALVGLPYSLKFLIAPFIDRLPLPVLTQVFGRRRAWALLAQALLMAALIFLGGTQPGSNLGITAALALATAFASASQDVVLDAYRVESLTQRQLAAGAATMVFGWRVGQMAAGAGGLLLAEVLPWPAVFAIMAGLILVGVIGILVSPEPPVRIEAPEVPGHGAGAAVTRRYPWLPPRLADVLAWLYDACVCPLLDFLTRPGWLAILSFIMLYKFGDAVLAVMKVPFFLEIGFSKSDIAEVVKLFGFAATILGGFIGGIVVARLGMMNGLLLCGVLMAASNLVFLAQAAAGADLAVLAMTISVENITTGMGTTAFVAYMSSLCNVAYTATQYALLTSLMAMSRTVLSSGAGWLADQLSWPMFFIVTTLAAVPGLVLLLWMMRRYPVTTPAPA